MVNMGKVQRLCLFLQKGFQKQNISKHGAQGGSTWNWLVGRLGSQIIKPYLLWWVTQLPTRKKVAGKTNWKSHENLEAAGSCSLLEVECRHPLWSFFGSSPASLRSWVHSFQARVHCLGTPQAWWANPRLCWESHDLGQTSQYLITGWWFGTCFMTFHSVGNGIIIPTDELTPSFFRGVGQPPTIIYHHISSYIIYPYIYIYILINPIKSHEGHDFPNNDSC